MNSNHNTTPRPAAELVGATKRYGDVLAVDGIDLALEPGKVTALLGANGAGKTTTVKMMLGIAAPDQGTVRLFGSDPQSAEARTRVGAMMQISKVPETLRVAEHVDLFRSYYPTPLSTERALAAAGLEGLERRLFGKLSGGQKQRVVFALAICGNPDLLFLDEPTVGFDAQARRAFWKEIRSFTERGRTVLLTTHYLEEADALADRVVVMHEGRIVADGTPAEIKGRAAAKKLRCVTRLDESQVAALEGVQSVRTDGHALEILSGSAEGLLRRLLELDPELADLEVTGADLEQAFLDLTSTSAAGANGTQVPNQEGAA